MQYLNICLIQVRSGQFSRRLWGSTRRISQVSAGETEYNPVEPPAKWAPRAFSKTCDSTRDESVSAPAPLVHFPALQKQSAWEQE